jgi:hypothetical protein
MLILGPDFKITYDGIRLYITLEPTYIDKVRGLCGTYNYDWLDDLTAANNIVETSIVLFSNTYKVVPDASTPLQTNPCDTMITVSLYFLNVSILENLGL